MPEQVRGAADVPADVAGGVIGPGRMPEVLETAPAIVWMWDPQRGCTYVNEAWARVLDRDPTEAIGQGWASCVHPDDLGLFEGCRAAMQRNEAFATEYRLRRADGTYALVNDQGFPLDASDPAGPFLGAALEVTAQRDAERSSRSRAERLDRVTQALSSSTSVEEIADAVFVDALDALDAPNGGLGLAAADRRSLTITRLRGFDEKRDAWRSISTEDDTPVTRALRDGRSAFYRSAAEVVAQFPHLEGALLSYQARVALPLRVDDAVLGVLYVAFDEEREFDPATRGYFHEVADRIAKALERARLFDAARHSEARTRTLQQVTADLAGAITVADVEKVTTRSACDAVAADGCLLAVVDGSRLVYADTDAYPSALRDLLPTSLDAGSSPVADVIATGRSQAFDTTEVLLASYPGLASLLAELPYTSRVFVPVVGSGLPVGVLVASSGAPGHFDDEAVGLLEAIAGQCGQAIERAALYRDARSASERAASLQAATLSMAEATSIDDVADNAMPFAVELVDATIGALAVLNPERHQLTVVRHLGAPMAVFDRWVDLPSDPSTVDDGSQIRDGRWHPLEELRRIDAAAADDLEPFGIRSIALLPLVGGGATLGLLGLARTDEEPPSDEQQAVLDAFTERVSAAVHRANLLHAERRTRRELERALSRLSRLQSVSAAISQAVSVPEVAATALDASMEALNAAGGGAYLADGDVLRCIAARGVFTSAAAGTLDAIPVSADMAMCAAYASGHLGWVPTLEEWRRRYPDGAAMFEGVARSSIAIPFDVEDGVLGVMTLVFTDEEVLDRAERRLARTIGHQAAVALERALLHEREMARSRRTEHLQQLIAELAASATPVGVASSLTSGAFDVVSARAVAVLLIDEDDGRIEVAAARGFSPRVVAAIENGEQAPGHATIRTQRPAFLRTAEQVAERYPGLADDLGAAVAELPMVDRGDTVGALVLGFDQARAFDPEQIDMLAEIAAEAAQATHRARVTQREREISRILQASLLPEEPVSSWNGTSVTTWYSAGTEHIDVGGDWYDAIELPNGRLGVSIGDVVGRGLRAGAAMGQLRSALRGLALERRGPGATLEALNRFAAMTPGTELATVTYGELDPITGTFTYACAGHPPPLALVGGQVELLDEGRSPLLAAGFDGHRGEATCQLPPGSTLVLYTDGLVERREEPFHRGIERLRATLERAAAKELPDLAETLIETLLGQRDRTDDAALLCLRTGIPASLTMTFPSIPEELRQVRQRLRDWLTIRSYPEHEAEALVLAVNEAAANAIEHGYRSGNGIVELTGEAQDGHLEVTITDHGSWKDGDPDPARGRGLDLMRTLMDDVEIRAGTVGTTVVLRQTPDDDDPARPAPGQSRSPALG
jgi:serine/threonine-protein kinase RsbW